MSFLTWNNQSDARTSLNSVNTEYGCPYVLRNGYRMDQWDFDTKSDARNEWGWFGPEERPGHTEEDLDSKLVPGYTKSPNRPDDWVPPGLNGNGNGNRNGNGNGGVK